MPRIRRFSDDEVARALEELRRSFDLVPLAPVLPLRVCQCGGVKFHDRIARYWGWHSVLLEEQSICLACGLLHHGGRMVCDESLPADKACS